MKFKQIDIDALWLAANVEISDKWARPQRQQAQLRLQHLADAGLITFQFGVNSCKPILVENINE